MFVHERKRKELIHECKLKISERKKNIAQAIFSPNANKLRETKRKTTDKKKNFEQKWMNKLQLLNCFIWQASIYLDRSSHWLPFYIIAEPNKNYYYSLYQQEFPRFSRKSNIQIEAEMITNSEFFHKTKTIKCH